MSVDINALESVFNTPHIEPFIRKIVFTNFKNIDEMEELIFDFPITVLVGQNGTNKTSALVALYGSVAGKLPSDFWFTTPLDKAGSEKEYSSFYYTYKDNLNTAEVLLINNQRTDKKNVDYWETDRPRKRFGMNTEIEDIQSDKKSQTRWNKINKAIVYINFRSELSAFDRCLYHANKPSFNYLTKQDYIRAKSGNLKNAISQNQTSRSLYGKEKILKNEFLSHDKVKIISEILNKKYESIQFIEHSFFDVIGGTAFLKTANLNYSEAYAGSGEFAVVSLVYKVMNAKPHSLILLDEPEVSLHPSAQKQLMAFLSNQVKLHKHQIVISTHAPEIIDCLPNNAIKLFTENEYSGKINIINKLDKSSVFSNIGRDYNKISIYVEDILAQKVVEKAIESSEELKNAFQVLYLAGGSESILQRFVVLSETDHKQIVLLDGDKMKTEYKNNQNSFPDSVDILDTDLDQIIEDYFFKGLKFSKNSNSTSYTTQRKFLDDAKKYISYLPFDSPEYFILQQNSLCSLFLTNQESKELFRKITKDEIGDDDGVSILATQKRYLHKIDSDCKAY